MKKLFYLLLLLLPCLAQGASTPLSSQYIRETGRFALPTNASFQALEIGTNHAGVTNGLWIRATQSGTRYLRIDDTNGTPRFQIGVFPGLPNYLSLWSGNVSPSTANFTFLSDGSELYLNAPSGILNFCAGGATKWLINGSGHFLADGDATYRIGSPGANRPLSIDVSGYGTFGGTVTAGSINSGGSALSSVYLYISTGGYLVGNGNGTFGLANTSNNDFNRLQFGGTTAAFPALTKSSGDMALTGGTGTITGSTNKLIAPAGIIYLTNSILPNAAQLGIGGYWVGNSNGNLVTLYSVNGTTTTMKILAP